MTHRTACIALLLAIAPLVARAQTARVSVASDGTEGNATSRLIMSLSADGRYVAFESEATNLVPDDTNARRDVFVHDRVTGTTVRASVSSSGDQGNAGGREPSISADGRFVAFTSDSTNLVPGDVNSRADIFVHDLMNGTTELVSVDSSGAAANDYSMLPAISGDGQLVSFSSNATNLVPGDTNGRLDVFAHDRITGATERISVGSAGEQGDDHSYRSRLSFDGRLVVFESRSRNLVSPPDDDLWCDVFVRDRQLATTELISMSLTGTGGHGDSFLALSGDPMTADGNSVVFQSGAPDLVANGVPGVYLRDRGRAVTQFLSVDFKNDPAGGADASISADGQLVTFESNGEMVEGDDPQIDDIWVRRIGGSIARLSNSVSGGEPNEFSIDAALSRDGSTVAFYSEASDLVSGDGNGVGDVFSVPVPSCIGVADAVTYGSGWPGSSGVPSLTSSGAPNLCSVIDLTITNSAPSSTTAVLFVGSRTDLPTVFQGHLLVLPILSILVGVPATGLTFPATIPCGDAFCGLSVALQSWELDPGASRGISFTPGLFLVLGP